MTHPHEQPPPTESEDDEDYGAYGDDEQYAAHGDHGYHRDQGEPEEQRAHDAGPPPTEHEEPPPSAATTGVGLTEREEPPPSVGASAAGLTEQEEPLPAAAATMAGPTEDEIPSAAPAQVAHGGRDLRGDTGALPVSLRRRFRLRAVLRRPDHPHQAAVYRVEDERGSHILKWYHLGHAPDRRVWEPLRDRPRRHLTHFTETGDTGADGHPYDLAPSYGETDLAGYLRDNPGPADPVLIHSVVRQLHEALTTLHELNIVHRDISPANIVLGSLDPAAPDLVLVDFAVSAHEPAERYTRDERWVGTALYMSPQASLRHQLIHPPADWWSLGMIVAEMAGGRHPVRFTDNDFVREEISSRAPDLSLVTGHRLRLLCMGLLTRDPDHRWGTDEVAQWLVGGSPPIAPWEAGTAPGASDPEDAPDIEPFAFLDERYTRPKQLARAFSENWRPARQVLSRRGGRGEFTRWLRQFEGAPDRDAGELAALLGLLEPQHPAAPPRQPKPITMVRLISWLGPTLDASYRGVPLDHAGLGELLREAGRGDEFALSVVADLRDHTILPLLDSRPGGDGLAEVQQRWLTARSRWQHTVEEVLHESPWLRDRRAEVRAATRLDRSRLAALLSLAAAPTAHRRRLQERTAGIQAALPQPVAWYGRLVRDPEDLVRLQLAEWLAGFAEQESSETQGRLDGERALLRQERDLDVATLWVRRQDMLPTLGWALGGAVAFVFPWIFVIGLGDLVGWPAQRAVVTAWMLAVPAAAAVLALELWTAYRIGSPGYHPDRSLAGLLIDRTLPVARFIRRPGSRFPVQGLLILPVIALLWATVAYAPWVWPLATVAVLIWWTWHRLRCWRRYVAELRGRDERHRPGRPRAAAPPTSGRLT
ncbi:protein kinase domain-containing protein [Streptomyces violaceusniger]|uniref:Serine/threonine protein kinase n=1 Tax=Streptomyces violaceusniger (strain Tu 4113) TaxID=653045 RepID=G2NUS1_STRV4|nr:protein kinase [Streptomyces violaceusniger]AEM84887.1 serine/threonine protein kinase [Streptomyces violaceusniger Tu 4113]